MSQVNTNEGRNQKFNEPSFVASVRMPVSSKKDYQELKASGYDIAKALQQVINQRKR